MKRNLTFRGLQLLLPLLLTCSALTSQATYTPVAVTGFNEDIVANGVGLATSSTTNDVDGVNYNFVAPDFQATASSPLPTYYLPANGEVNSVATSGLVYQLEPYASNNALRIATQNGTGSLTLVNPVAAGEIYLLGVSGSGASDVDVLVTFTDNTTQQFTAVGFPDWYGGAGFAIQGIGRVNRTNNNLEGNASDPRLYQRVLPLDPSNYAKQIASIEFTKTNAGGVLIIMAVTTNDVCSGSPVGGTATASVGNVNCPTATFTLDLTGHTTGVGMSYQWEFSPSGANMWLPLGTASGTSSYTVPGQTGSTDYRAVVTCANGGVSDISSVITVTSGNLSAPFHETFESNSSTRSCWTVLNENNDTDEWILNGTGYAHAGTNQAQIYTDYNAGANDDYLISPPIDLTGNERLRFWYRVRSAGEPNDYEVLLSTTGTAAVDFTTVLRPLTVASNTTYDEDTIDLSAYTGPVYIAFRVPPGGLDGWYLYFDDVVVETIPSCPGPVNLTAGNLTANSAELDWTESGTATQWRIEYGPLGFTPGNGTVVTPGSKPYLLTGLNPSTAYQFYVTALCSATDSMISPVPGTFYTTQIPVTTFPWLEGWETGGTEWTIMNGSETNQWHVGTATANGGTQSLYVSNDGGVSNTYSLGSTSAVHAYRDINFPAGVLSIDLSFDWKADGEGTPTGSAWDYIRVWLVPQTFVPVPGVEIDASSGGIQLGGNLVDQAGFGTTNFVIPNTYAGTNMRLVFSWRNDGSLGAQPPGAIDNIQIVVGNCPSPNTLSAGSITTNSAELSWTEVGVATEWLIEYGPQGFTQGTGTFIQTTNNPHTVTGLNPSTDYSFYMRSLCTATDSSAVSGPFNFTTLCAAYSPNMLEDFTTFPPLCWSREDGALGVNSVLVPTSNDWVTDNWMNTGGTPNGAAARVNLYNLGTRDWLISPTIDLGPGGTFYLEFDIAFLAWASTNGLALGSDDTAAVVISTDNGATWQLADALQIWTSANSGFTSSHVALTLTNYSGLVKIGFYGSEGVIDDPEDVEVIIDNFYLSNVPMSVVFSSIDAVNVGKRNRVDWKTGSETPGSQLQVERSDDGRNFETIATIAATGTGSAYSYWDETPFQGENYYRIQSVGPDGKRSYSGIVKAVVLGGFSINVWPNPARESISVRVDGTITDAARLTLTDLTGRIIRVVEVHQTVSVISLDGLSAGTYILQYADEHQNQTVKITKQ